MPVTDETRVRFKTYIAKELLDALDSLAHQAETHVGYLIENGLKNLIADPDFVFDKSKRIRGKTEFRTTCDEDTGSFQSCICCRKQTKRYVCYAYLSGSERHPHELFQ